MVHVHVHVVARPAGGTCASTTRSKLIQKSKYQPPTETETQSVVVVYYSGTRVLAEHTHLTGLDCWECGQWSKLSKEG